MSTKPGQLQSHYPRMALVRCVVLTSAGEVEGAKRVYEAAAAETDGFTRDRAGGDDRALRIDHIFVEGLLHMCGCVPYGSGIMAAIAGAEAVADAADTDPLLRGMFSLGMCIASNQMTAFEEAAEWAGRARAALGRDSPYLAHVDFQVGSVAMARGRTGKARACHERALKVARASHLRDAGVVMVGEALAPELNPDEIVWNHSKTHGVRKRLLQTPAELRRYVLSHLRSLQRTPTRLRGFFQKPSLRYITA